MNKVLIFIEGGIVQWTASIYPTEILIVDMDAIEEGESPVREPEKTDLYFKEGQAHTLFPDIAEREIMEDLRRIKF